MQYFLILTLLVLTSCGGDDSSAGTGETVQLSKNLFSSWTNKGTGDGLDLTGGSFDTNLSLTNASVVFESDWVTTLSSAGRTNLPTAGVTYYCDYELYIVGSNTSGGFALDTNDDTDSIANNACLFLDSNCANGTVCHYSSDHQYTNINGNLTVDWFGTADSGDLGTDSYE